MCLLVFLYLFIQFVPSASVCSLIQSVPSVQTEGHVNCLVSSPQSGHEVSDFLDFPAAKKKAFSPPVIHGEIKKEKKE